MLSVDRFVARVPQLGVKRCLGSADDGCMAPSVFLLAVGVGSGLIGAATATDLVSLRAVAHAVDVPVLSTLLIGLREAMPTSLAHALEPACGVFGGLLAAIMLLRHSASRPAAQPTTANLAPQATLAASYPA